MASARTRLFQDRFKVGEDSLLRLVWHQTLQRPRQPFVGMDYRTYFVNAFQHVASQDCEILSAVISGSLASRYANDPGFKKKMDDYADVGAEWPVIYGNFFVKMNGDAMSPEELVLVCDKMDQYVTNLAYARATDVAWYNVRANKNVVNPSTGKKGRGRPVKGWVARDTTATTRYIVGAGTGHVFNSTIKNNIVRLTTAIRARFTSITPGQPAYTQPADRPLSEFGWAKNAAVRLEEHRRFAGSNYLMSLFRAILELEFPLMRVELRQFPVCYVWEPAQGAIAGGFMTEVGQGYIDNGCGFSHWTADANSSSSLEVSAGTYHEVKNYVVDQGFQARLDDMIARRIKRIETIQRIKDKQHQLHGLQNPDEDQLRKNLVERVAWLKSVSGAIDKLQPLADIEEAESKSAASAAQSPF